VKLDEIIKKFCTVEKGLVHLDGHRFFSGRKERLKLLEVYQITEELQAVSGDAFIGFSPESNSWYALDPWRIYSFTIGTKITYGHPLYRPKDLADYLNYAKVYMNYKGIEAVDGCIRYYSDDEGIILTCLPDYFGRGEYTIKTMAQAKKAAKELCLVD